MEQHVNGARLEVELIAMTPEPEKVIEQAGRTCYLSFDRMEEDSAADFIRRLIKVGHESPLEHAYATFRIRNCSRAMTHQLVRHRLMAISQQSQRYVNEEQFSYVIPESMPAEFVEDFRRTRGRFKRCTAVRPRRREDARFVHPTRASARLSSPRTSEWHIFCRARPLAMEIRRAADLTVLKEHAPACFDDIANGQS
jgi:thymidylate synthase (FAD)